MKINISYSTYQTCIAIMFVIIIILIVIAVYQYRKNQKYRDLDANLLSAQDIDYISNWQNEEIKKYPENEKKLDTILTKEEEKFVDDFYRENPHF